MRPRRATRGFTLLELMAAVMIFALMSAFALVSLQDSTDMALGSVRARELRLLAERKMGEVLVFEKEYDDLFDGENFDDYDDQLYEGWEWKLDIRDVVIYGTTNDEAADYLFGDPEEDDEESTEEDANPDEPEGETQFLREVTLQVFAPAEEGFEGDGDSVTIVTFVPLVDYGPGGAGAAPNNAGGGN